MFPYLALVTLIILHCGYDANVVSSIKCLGKLSVKINRIVHDIDTENVIRIIQNYK